MKESAEAKRTAEERQAKQVAAQKKYQQKEMTVALPHDVGLEMVKIQAGTFMMGSPIGKEFGRFDDAEQHQVTLTKDYWLGKYPVTQAQWKAVMGNNPSYFNGENRPVEQVNWAEAKKFCDKLNELYAGLLPKDYKFDLSTEAQWEYACRAGTTTALNNGKDLTSGTGACYNLNEVAWYGENSNGETHAVGMKQPNVWGLYDMHGNVWEWCRDWYEHDYAKDPEFLKGNTGSYRVFRGGCWSINAWYCRSAYRGNLSPTNRHDDLGFRLALVPVQ